MTDKVRAIACPLPLYSRLLAWLEANPQPVATARQWQGMLDNLQNVRKEEIERAGLSDLAIYFDPDQRITQQELLDEATRNLATCFPTLKSFRRNEFRPGLEMKAMTGTLPRRIEPKAKRFVEKAENCYLHPSMGYWIIRSNYEDVVTVAPNWVVLDYKGKMLDSCWFPSALEAFDAMHQTIRKTLEGYGSGRPDTHYDEYTFLGGKNYQEWFLCLPEWPLPYHDGHFAMDQLLVHIRTTERVDLDGNPLLMVEEIQSPWHADIRKHGSSTHYDDIIENLQVADAPFAKEWHALAIKAVIALAMQKNCNRVGFTTGRQQCQRWWREMKGLMNLYDKDIPKCLNKIAAQYECINDWATIATRHPIGFVIRADKGEWLVKNMAGEVISPNVKSKDIALHYLRERSTPVNEKVRVLQISSQLKNAVKAGEIPLFG